MALSDRFATLLSRLEPSLRELLVAQTHSRTIKSRLQKDFELKRFCEIGSHSRGTEIHSFSDVDNMAVLARDEVRYGGNLVSSSTLLRRVRDSLLDRFPSTNVRRDQQAVVVEFEKGAFAVDIVPAFFLRPGPNNWPTYGIPDGTGGWMATNPDSHGKYIRDADRRAGYQLSKTARLLKFWRVCRASSIPVLSFHLEILLAREDICAGARSYSGCLLDAFTSLRKRRCASIQDPLGVSGYIPAARTDSQLEVVRQAVEYAFDHSRRAVVAELGSDLREAYRQWDLVFNGRFPSR